MASDELRGAGQARIWRLAILGPLVAAVFVLAAACASRPPPGPSLDEFRAARSQGDVVRLTTEPPVRCSWSRPGHELCTWRFGNGDSAWWVLAPSVETPHQVNFVCEFASDGSPGERECEVIPRIAEEFRGTPPVSSRPRGTRGARRNPPAANPEEAWGEIESARTASEMTRFVGDVADRCAAVDAHTQLCTWEAGTAHRGYEVLAVAAGSDSWIALSCAFPSDGSERAAGTCRAERR
jgi:hypothetical protein